MPADAHRARVFFALWPGAALAQGLHRLAREAHGRFGGRVMRRETLHLTLAFIGTIERTRIADLVAAGDRVRAPRIELSIDTLGQWQKKHIVWAGPGEPGAALVSLVESLRAELEAAGVTLERRPFVPHVTLLRNADCDTGRNALARPLKWQADGFVLVESKLQATGAGYEVLARWPRQ